jgi:acetyltransferase
MGGQLVEVFKDSALSLPPLTSTLARRMMERTRIYTALKGVRGRPPVDLVALEQLVVRFSELVVEQRFIQELDINPLIASFPPFPRWAETGLLALDARVIVYPQEVTREQLPRLAIRPYPLKYVGEWTTPDGKTLTIRPIRPEDEPMMVEYHKKLSERTVYMRYLHPMALDARISHERLSRIVFIDYNREMALVAEYQNPQTGQSEIVAVGRLTKIAGSSDAEYSILITDEFQGQGLGTELLRRLIQVGRDDRVKRIVAYISNENHAMQKVSKRLGFELHRSPDDPGIVEAELVL